MNQSSSVQIQSLKAKNSSQQNNRWHRLTRARIWWWAAAPGDSDRSFWVDLKKKKPYKLLVNITMLYKAHLHLASLWTTARLRCLKPPLHRRREKNLLSSSSSESEISTPPSQMVTLSEKTHKLFLHHATEMTTRKTTILYRVVKNWLSDPKSDYQIRYSLVTVQTLPLPHPAVTQLPVCTQPLPSLHLNTEEELTCRISRVSKVPISTTLKY